MTAAKKKVTKAINQVWIKTDQLRNAHAKGIEAAVLVITDNIAKARLDLVTTEEYVILLGGQHDWKRSQLEQGNGPVEGPLIRPIPGSIAAQSSYVPFKVEDEDHVEWHREEGPPIDPALFVRG